MYIVYKSDITHILKSPTSQRKTDLDSVSLSRHNSSEILRHCWLLMPHFSYWTRFPWVQCGLPGAPQRYLYYIKLFLSTPWKHKGGWIYSSTHSEPRPVNCTPRPVNLQREPHHALKKTGCAPEPVWAFWSRKDLLLLPSPLHNLGINESGDTTSGPFVSSTISPRFCKKCILIFVSFSALLQRNMRH